MPTYPLTLPSTIAPVSSSFRLQRATAITQSPFTGKTRAYQYEKAVWKATISYPPMSNRQANEFRAFLINLQGRFGTFKMGDPDRVSPTGNIVTSGDVASGSQKMIISTASVGAESITGNWFSFKSGWPTNGVTDGLFAGDMISINNQLYMVTDNVNTFNNYSVTINIQPALKTAISASFTLDFEVPQHGIWRLDTDEIGWDSNHMKNHGISFSCTEVI